MYRMSWQAYVLSHCVYLVLLRESLMEKLFFMHDHTSLKASVRNGLDEYHLHQNRMECVFLRFPDWRADFLAHVGKISIGCASV